MANASGRFFGWVMGASLPTALAADWLVSAWDQNAGMRDATPGVVGVEEVAAAWLLELLGLPAERRPSGSPPGATMANFTCLAAARDRVLGRAGWDVAADGLSGAPRVRVLVGAEGHGSVELALRYLGLGTPEQVAVDEQGRLDPERPARAGWRATWARRSSACRRATSTPAPSTRWRGPSRSPTAPAPGCTWTAPSGSGPPSSRPSPPLTDGLAGRRLLGDGRAQDAEHAL